VANSISLEAGCPPPDELYRAYIRRFAEWVAKSKQGDPRAAVMLSTAARNEVKEAEALAGYLFKQTEPESAQPEQ